MESSGFIIFFHSVKKDLPGLGDAASDDDDFGVNDAVDVGDGFSQHLADFIYDRE